MKELSIEQKVKAYDEALARARKLLENSNGMILKKWLWNIFPELKESEGEKIRKWLIGYFNQYIIDGMPQVFGNGLNVKDVIAWLEKQDNKSVNIDIDSMITSYKQRLKSQAGIRMENNPLVNMCSSAFRRGVENTLEELNLRTLEKQGEQEFIDSDTLIQQRVDTLADIDAKQSSADNVKPKVKNEIEIPFGAKDSELQEATYFIPKGFYAEIDDDKVVIKKGEKPAAWSEEDEELVKWSINNLTELKDRFGEEYGKVGKCIDWLKSLKDRITWKLSEKPAEWSEDDERIKKRLINLVNEIYNNTNYITFLEHKELLAWLEKLDDNVEL